mmetsp:Transcript_12536/g.24997  ORF Transcript_12536/g.24997 Transcript_12536/m.24997 type:complete len:292 (+) Transcript_12536:394-1269(+)
MFWQGREDVQQADPVRFVLPQPQDAPAAHANPRVPHVGDGLQPVLVAPGGDDLGIVFGRRVEVVVVGRQSRLLELLRLFGCEHAEGAAHLHSHPVGALDHFEDVSESVLFLAEFAPGSSHAEPRGSGLLCAPCRLEHFLHLHSGCRFDEGLVSRGLGAVGAVLRAPARLDGEERALLYLRGVPVHAVDRGRFVEELVEGQVENFGDFCLRPIVSDGGLRGAHAPSNLVFRASLPVQKIVGGAPRGRRMEGCLGGDVIGGVGEGRQRHRVPVKGGKWEGRHRPRHLCHLHRR